MGAWTRIKNVFRRERVAAEIEEEFRLHLEDAVAAGRDPEEARRAFGAMLQRREESQDAKVAGWLEAMRSDFVFGWRLLKKHKAVTGAAVLSLALTMGACVGAFRLIDAMLLRPLPVRDPSSLYVLTYEMLDQNGKKLQGDIFEYPIFRELRAAVAEDAELIAVSPARQREVVYGPGDQAERAQYQYVSGTMFEDFGLSPVLGRLLTPADDVTPGGHPVAVISHDYWVRRFGRDTGVAGRTFRMEQEAYTILGVAPQGFTGTETGRAVDLFLPMMANRRAINDPDWGWFRTLVRVRRGASVESVKEKLVPTFQSLRRETVKRWRGPSPARIASYVNAPLHLAPAPGGVSYLQRDTRKPLWTLGALAAMLLLLACGNAANLMVARAAARGREMALRVSIGAGRWRLLQLVLAESVLVALAAAVLGGLLAWWSAPWVVSWIDSADDPVRLSLPVDARVLGFAGALTALVTLLFGLAPAWQASGVRPMESIRGDQQPRDRRRLMNALIAGQVALCLLVQFLGGLFVASFFRLTNEPAGFRTERLLAFDVNIQNGAPPEHWEDLEARLRAIPGVESAAACGWPLMSQSVWTTGVRRVGEADWDNQLPYVLPIAPGWLETMGIELLAGRDFRAGEKYPGAAIVNESFARRYFDGANPVGRMFEQAPFRDRPMQIEVLGLVKDAKYQNVREAPRPTMYVPFRAVDAENRAQEKQWGALIVRTRGKNSMEVAGLVRAVVEQARPGFKVVSFQTQDALVKGQLVKERLLAALSLFFAAVALILAGTGLFGVLNYAVVQRRREIGIRMALGARWGRVAWRVSSEPLVMVALGAASGLAGGLWAEQHVRTLLHAVKGTDWAMQMWPLAVILLVAVAAAVPPVLAAVRMDPARVLRAD